MQEIILSIISQFGYLGIFLLITVENIFPPIPSEVILTFGGFLTTYTSLNVLGVSVAATGGSVAGALILYLIGYQLKAKRIAQLFDGKAGKFLRLSKKDLKMAESWFVRHEKKAVFLCRFVPIVRSLISLPAGMAKMRFSTFLGLTILGSFLWNVVLVLLGRLAGSAWEAVVSYLDIYTTAVLVIFILVAIILAARFLKKRFKWENDKGEQS
ncbi:MAG: DedA family protein [Firmicutes bacterium]|nr:DedA family protein [Bacillota bacterium]